MKILMISKKKRKPSPKTWKRNIAKDQLNKGLSFISTLGIEMPAKSMKEPCSLKCKQSFRENISEEQRQKNLNSFYEHGNQTRQWDYIARHVESRATEIRRLHSNRLVTKSYLLSVLLDPLGTAQRIIVCQVFLNTLAITSKWVITAEKKLTRFRRIVVEHISGSRHRIQSCSEGTH
jgi:hypothetical protein